MKVVAYLRCSTEEQNKSGLGLEAQLSKVKGYAELYDLEIVSIEQDALSGKTLKGREGLQRALAMLKTGKVEGLICSKLDRLTRNVRDLGSLLEDHFNKHSLFIVQEQVDTRSASGRLVLNLLCSVAQWERETIGERTKEGLKALRARGMKTGGLVPYGLDADEEGRLTVNLEEQKVISLIRELQGKRYSMRGICRELQSRGFKTRQGDMAWQPMMISRVLKQAA